MKRQWSWLLMSLALVAGLVSIFATSRQGIYGSPRIQSGRTWTVCAQGCDFATVQQAVDTAEAGDHILIKPGTYAEHLVIRKNIFLEGSGAQETIIKGAQPNKPLIFIPDGTSIEVRLANLALIESFTQSGYPVLCVPEFTVGQCPAGIEVGGPAKLSLYHIRLSDHSLGIWVYSSSARVQLFESKIGSAHIAGILLWHRDAELLVVSSESAVGYSPSITSDFFPKKDLWAKSARQVTVVDSTFSRSDEAIEVSDQAQVIVINTRFLRNAGVLFGQPFTDDKVKAVILNSVFIESSLRATAESQISVVNSRFKKGGIGLSGQARAAIYGSEIVESYGSGVFLDDSVYVYLEGNRIADNRDWGVSLDVPQCGYQFGTSAPQISGRDNEIPDKDQSHGNKKGALCPSDYPWPPGFRK